MNDSTAGVINDIHSLLNESRVSRIETPRTQDELRRTVTSAAEAGDTLSVAGGRHAMGGQQFLSGGILLDTSGLNRILSLDAERGLAQVEAGILWDGLVTRLREMQQGLPQRWSIVQKQTGADRLSIGGALSANGHGRGLSYAPIVQDVESLELVDAEGVLRHCSRTENPELFGLAVGGYGLFGAIYSATLRLMPAHYLRRFVRDCRNRRPRGKILPAHRRGVHLR
jgi:FAD/FMN-containing dehydrogenase